MEDLRVGSRPSKEFSDTPKKMLKKSVTYRKNIQFDKLSYKTQAISLLNLPCIGIPSGLKEMGAREEDLEILAVNAMQDICNLTNPREFSKEDIIEIYRKVCNGKERLKLSK